MQETGEELVHYLLFGLVYYMEKILLMLAEKVFVNTWTQDDIEKLSIEVAKSGLDAEKKK